MYTRRFCLQSSNSSCSKLHTKSEVAWFLGGWMVSNRIFKKYNQNHFTHNSYTQRGNLMKCCNKNKERMKCLFAVKKLNLNKKNFGKTDWCVAFVFRSEKMWERGKTNNCKEQMFLDIEQLEWSRKRCK